ncbi:MAG: BamA/TamA family outer membrane protein [Bacteroidota bacterium]|nr:BamA/TamA family outer membrane protein [Bacteroidota bacterium]
MRKYIFFFFVQAVIAHQAIAQEKGKLLRLIDKTYSLIEGDSAKPRKSYLFVLPIWGVSPETGWRLGLSFGFLYKAKQDGFTRPSLLRLNTQFTQNKQFSIRPTIDLFFAENKYNLKAEFVYNKFNEYYWGIGNLQTDTTKELYNFKQNRFNIKLTRQFVKNLYLGAQLKYDKLYQIDFDNPASITQLSGVSGINGFQVLGLGFAITYDNRDNIYYPLKGSYIDLSNLTFQKVLGSKQAFDNYTLDARHFVCLWKQNVLAAQVFGNFNFGDVPYRQMGTMGNDMIMRGYYNGRYRDHHLVAFQVELRKTIWGPVGMTVFGGGGNVGANSKDLFSRIKPNYGLGLRCLVIRKEHVNIRIDLGLGEKNIKGLYFTMAEAF